MIETYPSQFVSETAGRKDPRGFTDRQLKLYDELKKAVLNQPHVRQDRIRVTLNEIIKKELPARSAVKLQPWMYNGLLHKLSCYNNIKEAQRDGLRDNYGNVKNAKVGLLKQDSIVRQRRARNAKGVCR